MAGSKRGFEMMASAHLADAVLASDADADHRNGDLRTRKATTKTALPTVVLGRWAMAARHTAPFPVEYMRCDSIFFSE
jgi:hypothetical protein